jgi:hypothetical protein
MIKLIFFVSAILTFSVSNAQTLTTSLSGTFVEGIVDVYNVISVDTEAPGTASVTFYSTDPTYTNIYDSFTDTDNSDGYSWDADMGNMFPGCVIWAEFNDASNNLIDYSPDYPFNIIPMPHWLVNGGSVENVFVDLSSSTISFDGVYPIFEYNYIIDPSIKGIGNRPLDVVG